MKAALPGLLLLAALLVIPFALRPGLEAPPDTERRLVLLTSHNEALRYEMGRGFRRYLAERGLPPVRLDWRSPGGTQHDARGQVDPAARLGSGHADGDRCAQQAAEIAEIDPFAGTTEAGAVRTPPRSDDGER